MDYQNRQNVRVITMRKLLSNNFGIGKILLNVHNLIKRWNLNRWKNKESIRV